MSHIAPVVSHSDPNIRCCRTIHLFFSLRNFPTTLYLLTTLALPSHINNQSCAFVLLTITHLHITSLLPNEPPCFEIQSYIALVSCRFLLFLSAVSFMSLLQSITAYLTSPSQYYHQTTYVCFLKALLANLLTLLPLFPYTLTNTNLNCTALFATLLKCGPRPSLIFRLCKKWCFWWACVKSTAGS